MKFYVYITTNPNGDVMYIGFTNSLEERIIEHYLNRGNPQTYAGRYFCYMLLYYEEFRYVNDAIAREKEIKKWRREKKEQLISSFNPERKSLNKELFGAWPLPEKELYHRKDL